LLFVVSASFAMGEKSSKTDSLDFTLQDINGQTHTLSDYKGKYVFLNFWATWCPPCREEMPSMQKLYDSWDKNSYVMLAVNIKEPKDRVKSFAANHKYTFPILLDSDGSVAGKYGMRGIPTTFFVDQYGKIAGKIVGSHHWDIKTIKKIFKDKP